MPNLDLVRSIAVLSVVVEHLLLVKRVFRIGPFEVAWVGVLGVEVFFVLTCLVLMWSLERKPHTLDFYIRRVFRIYPLAIAALLLAFLFHAPTGGTPAHFFMYQPTGLKHLAGQAALWPGVAESQLSVMWSLPYEVAMYVLLPALFFFVRADVALWPLLLLWAFVVAMMRGTSPQAMNFGVTLGYFLPGVIAYAGFRLWKPLLPGWLLPVLLAVLWVVFWWRADFHRGWFFCLLVGLGLPLFRQITTPLVRKPSEIVARYSYGIYLTHPLALALGFYVLASHAPWMQWTAFAAALVVLPLAAFHGLEKPLIRVGSRLAARVERYYEMAGSGVLTESVKG